MIPAMALSLFASACGGGDDSGSGGGPAAEGGGDGTFSMYIGEPENPLIPGNTNETEGGQVVDSLFTGLVTYDAETNEAVFDGVAESIESEDQQTWTVSLKDGWTFHDGSPVTAQSFVDAWNYTALSTNAQGNSYFFSNVEGYEDLQAETDEADNVIAPPVAQEMSGLRVIDDSTFEVTLSEPFAQYPLTTGYTAFYPLPQSFYDDPEGFGRQPVGNGPFMATEPFQPGRGVTLTRYEEFGGAEPAQAAGVEYRVYTDVDVAYRDVQAGNLDIVDQVPADALGRVEAEFGERFIERPRGDIAFMAFPTYDPRFADPDVRKAFSMAVDREAITEAIFQGTKTPAASFISPVVDGYREDACGPCQFDPQAAKQMLDATGFDTSQPVDLWFNAGADHDQWVQAIGNQLRDNLGIEYVLRGDLQFAEYLPLIDERGMTGPFRYGWVMDYPSPQNFLEPLFSTEALPPAGSNGPFYSNPEFDRLVNEANAAADNDQAIELYQQAEDVLIQDLPSMPVYYGVNQLVHSDDTENVIINAFSRVQAEDVQVTG